MLKNRCISLMAQCPQGLLILSSHPVVYRQHDVSYSYEAGPHFRYITQLNIHPCTIVIMPDNTSHVFLPSYDPERFLWDGPRVDVAHPTGVEADHIHALESLPAWLAKHGKMIPVWLTDPSTAQMLEELCDTYIDRFYDITPAMDSIRSIKDSYALQEIQKAADITILSHLSVMQHAKAFVHESFLEGQFLFTGYAHGYRDVAYPPIVASGMNATILHYHNSTRQSEDGDWLLIDAAWQSAGYNSDVTRTYPLHKKATGLRRAVYECVLDVQQSAIAQVAPGMDWVTITQYAENRFIDNINSLNIFAAPLTKEQLKKYFPHRLGHWLGLAVHDTCPYIDASGQPVVWDAGMVLTIEPGLYFPLDDQAIPEVLRGFGVRIEDDIVVTELGYLNLTQGLPVLLDDIAHV